MDIDLLSLGDLNGWIGDRIRAALLVLLKFQNRMIMVEEWWSSVLFCVWVIHTLCTGVCISTQRWQGVKMEWR